MLAVTAGGRQFAAIERNPSKRAPGGQLARIAIRSSKSRTFHASRFMPVALKHEARRGGRIGRPG